MNYCKELSGGEQGRKDLSFREQEVSGKDQ